ncbi:MAG: DUF1800 domain-containing protein, partial [Planctomycetota bacterium]|nr:DUF1800 domain-containing protein [Planctomycetota bacterium]
MIGNSLSKLDSKEFDVHKAQHLLNRAGFGGNIKQIEAIAKMGLEKAVDFIVDYDNIQDPMPIHEDAFDKDIMRPATKDERASLSKIRASGDEAALEVLRKERQKRQRQDRKQVAEMEEWWLKRIIETPRPLEEKLALFWHGHFATGYRTIENSYHMFQQNNLFRTHALGNFKEDLVRGVIHDPAMIRYLNNNQNRKGSPNENLARELMELFTLGEGQDYTEDDIKEGARTLTGYDYDDDVFVFRARQHDSGTKTIFKKHGQFNGDDFVDLIFTRRSAATFVIWKMYRFFVNDLPHEPSREVKSFVQAIGNLFKRNNWELKPVIKAIFLSKHFYDQSNINSIIKSPVQLIVQAMRSINPPQRKKMLRTLTIASDLMGQRLFGPPSVKGWDGGRSWINTSTMFMR